MEKFTGKVWVLGDDIDTDIIIPTEYLALKTIDDMKQYGFSHFVRNWLDRFRKVTSLLPAKILAAVLPESRHRRLSKHWEFSVSLQNHLQEFSSETPSTTGFC